MKKGYCKNSNLSSDCLNIEQAKKSCQFVLAFPSFRLACASRKLENYNYAEKQGKNTLSTFEKGVRELRHAMQAQTLKTRRRTSTRLTNILVKSETGKLNTPHSSGSFAHSNLNSTTNYGGRKSPSWALGQRYHPRDNQYMIILRQQSW